MFLSITKSVMMQFQFKSEIWDLQVAICTHLKYSNHLMTGYNFNLPSGQVVNEFVRWAFNDNMNQCFVFVFFPYNTSIINQVDVSMWICYSPKDCPS